jgi:hypothetical protein
MMKFLFLKNLGRDILALFGILQGKPQIHGSDDGVTLRRSYLGGIIFEGVHRSSETSGWSLGGAVLFLADRQRRVSAAWHSGILTAFA